MGKLINGRWHDDNLISTHGKNGEFTRPDSILRNSLPVKDIANRYHLYVSLACPWAHRTLIVRKIKKLEEAISVSVVSPLMGKQGWTFDNSYPGATGDQIYGSSHLMDLYKASDAQYTGRVTVPVLWDKELKKIVNNESSEIIRILNKDFPSFSDSSVNLYPESLGQEIDKINESIYQFVNNGVYRCGFAQSQIAYDSAVKKLFEQLHVLDYKLSKKDFLVGNQLTEADVRLFPTLIRFDIVYYSHFKCNLKMIKDFKYLTKYLKRLMNIRAFRDTTDFEHIKDHYFWSQTAVNPNRIIPIGPQIIL